MDTEHESELHKECRIGWLSVESDFSARLVKPEVLKYALQVMGRNPSDEAIEQYWAQAGGSLSYDQFRLVMRREKKTSMNDLMRAFRRIDSNGDGFITAQELHRNLTKRGEKMTTNEVQAIIAEADLNGDGKLDYAEFCHMLSNTANQCVRASHQKWAQTSEHLPPKSQVSSMRRNLERRDQHREEIRMRLYSAEGKNTPTDGSIQSDFKAAQVPQSRLDPEEVDLPAAATTSAQNKSSGERRPKMELHSSGELTLASGEDPLSTKLPPLKKVSLPSALQPPSSDGIEYTDSSKNSSKSQLEESRGEEGVNAVAENHGQQHEDQETANSHEARQTDHLLAKGQPPFSSNNREVQNDEPSSGDMEGQPSSLCEDDKEKEEESPSPSKEGGSDHCADGKVGGVDCLPNSVKVDSAKLSQDGGDGGVPKVEGVTVSPSSVVTTPPRKPTDTESWNSITGKGCFYLEPDGEEEECEIKSHRYHLVLPAPTNVWVEMGVANPGIEETDVLLLTFRTNEEEEVTDIITYTQHKVGDRWICRMDLDAGTYALVPFTSGCHLKPLGDVSRTHVALTTTKEGVRVLTLECLQVLEEIFHRIDLDNNGYISRTEFDFFQEVTGGELCDDDAWNIILSNFDVTDEEEITLKGFLALHEMAAADEEGGEEELRQVVNGMGYDKQLHLNQACPFSFEVLTEDCEGEIEIIDLLPFSPVTNPTFAVLAMERGVAGPVKGEEEGELATHTFTTPHMTTLVVENKSSKKTYVQLDCSQSVNCITSRESTVHVIEVAANSSSIGYHFRPANSNEPHRVHCIASKILT